MWITILILRSNVKIREISGLVGCEVNLPFTTAKIPVLKGKNNSQ